MSHHVVLEPPPSSSHPSSSSTSSSSFGLLPKRKSIGGGRRNDMDGIGDLFKHIPSPSSHENGLDSSGKKHKNKSLKSTDSRSLKRTSSSNNSQRIVTSSRARAQTPLEIEDVMDEEDLINSSRLVVNLYPEDRGYTFSFGDLNTESPLIDYSDRYLLDAIDRQEIPAQLLFKTTSKGNPWNVRPLRNHILAEIRDFRSGGGSQRSSPLTQEIVLGPGNLVEDFETLIQHSYKKRRKIRKKEGYVIQVESEDDVLSYEERLDLEKKFIYSTSGPLCLDPSPRVGNLLNSLQYERNKWNDRRLRASVEGYRRSLHKERVDREIAQNCAEEQLRKATKNAPKFGIIDLVQRLREKRAKRNIEEMTIVPPPPVKYQDYPPVGTPTPSELEDILKIITPGAEPAVLRPLSNECVIHKKEEFILETERRKRPHTTKLSIFQRGDDDSYFGELQMEAIDTSTPSPSNPLIPNPVFPPPLGSNRSQNPQAPSFDASGREITKCTFELGSLRSVQLYVRQFSEIFTEDGRRPCRVTYEKMDEGGPKVIYQSPKIVTTQGSGPQATLPQSSTPSPLSNPKTPSPAPPIQPSSSTSASSSAPPGTSGTPSSSQPPVQIVHPQPRGSWQAVTSTSGSSAPIKIYNTASTSTNINRSTSSTANSVNFNANVKSNSVVGIQQPQQILTRPPVQQQRGMTPLSQQQRPQIRIKSNNGINTGASTSNNNNTLATLLLAGIQPNSGNNSRPITMAIQPQPQTMTISPSQGQGLGTPSVSKGQGIMVIPPQPQNLTNQSTLLNIGSTYQNFGQQHPNQMGSLIIRLSDPNQLNQAQNSLRGAVDSRFVLSNSTSNVNMGGSHIGGVSGALGNQVSLNLNAIGLDRIISVSSANVVSSYSNVSGLNPAFSNVGMNHGGNINILHVNNSNQRQIPNAVSIMSPPGLIISSNNNGGPSNEDQGQIEVPDINSLLGGGSGGGSKQANLDRLNLNLKLNLNLNLSGTPPGASNGPQGNVVHQNTGSSSEMSDNSIYNNNTIVEGAEMGKKMDGGNGGGGGSPTKGGGMASSSGQGGSGSSTSGMITLNDLLTPMMVTSSSQQILSSPTAGNNAILMSPHSISPTSSTPRLSALLASCPSADSGNIGPTPSNISLVDSSSNSNLLDRLAQNLTQPSQRTGLHRSGLNPLATASPNVVLEHPVLATCLTQAPNRATVYRQIAPAPPAYSAGPQQQAQQQQLINLLGLVGSSNNVVGPRSGNTGQNPQNIRINAGKPSNPSGNNR